MLFLYLIYDKKEDVIGAGDHLYKNYHDTVWGVPCFKDNILFESLTLEIFQSD